jgi:hypothetical protein
MHFLITLVLRTVTFFFSQEQETCHLYLQGLKEGAYPQSSTIESSFPPKERGMAKFI